MFDLRNAVLDLEKSFAEWRWQMLAAGIKAPEPLEELENHLREDVERQMRLAATAQEAFDAAVRRIGEASELQREFKKASRSLGSARFWWVPLGVGSFGLMQTAMLNFFGPVIFHRHSSVLFSPKWWANWFPAYTVWISFILIGAALAAALWRAQRKAVRQ